MHETAKGIWGIRKGLECRSFYLHGVGVHHHHLASTWTCSPTWKLSTSILLVFLWRPHHIRMINHPSDRQSLSPAWRIGVGLKVPSCNHGLVFQVTSPHSESIQEPNKSHLIKTKDIPITQGIPCRSSVPGTKGRDQCRHTRIFPIISQSPKASLYYQEDTNKYCHVWFRD